MPEGYSVKLQINTQVQAKKPKQIVLLKKVFKYHNLYNITNTVKLAYNEPWYREHLDIRNKF